MRSKHGIIKKSKHGIVLLNGIHRRAGFRNKMQKKKAAAEEEPPNQAVFGTTIGPKVENDSTKIGSIGAGSNKHHIRFVRTGTGEPADDLAERLKKISFKEKKKRNNIQLII